MEKIIKVWLTEKEAQDYLGIGRTSLWKLRREGSLHYSIVGKKVYYHKPSIDDLLLRNSTLFTK